MEKQVYMFDIDGVLADSWIPVLAMTKQELGLEFAYEDLDHFAAMYDLVLAKSHDETMAKWADDQWFVGSVLRQSPPVDGAVKALQQLSEQGVLYFACTSRLAENRQATMEWFEEHFPFVPRERIFIRTTEEERSISGDNYKQQIAHTMGATRHYDDSLTALAKTHVVGVGELLLISRPWNHHDHNEHLRYDRVNSVFDHLVG
jgi:phosphoglycolate phosphatase-like HAD superfamily hydrolase